MQYHGLIAMRHPFPVAAATQEAIVPGRGEPDRKVEDPAGLPSNMAGSRVAGLLGADYVSRSNAADVPRRARAFLARPPGP